MPRNIDEKNKMIKARIKVPRFFEVLFFILLILKLTEYIDWAWWLVTMPLWAPMALKIFVIAVVIFRGSIRRI